MKLPWFRSVPNLNCVDFMMTLAMLWFVYGLWFMGRLKEKWVDMDC